MFHRSGSTDRMPPTVRTSSPTTRFLDTWPFRGSPTASRSSGPDSIRTYRPGCTLSSAVCLRSLRASVSGEDKPWRSPTWRGWPPSTSTRLQRGLTAATSFAAKAMPSPAHIIRSVSIAARTDTSFSDMQAAGSSFRLCRCSDMVTSFQTRDSRATARAALTRRNSMKPSAFA